MPLSTSTIKIPKLLLVENGKSLTRDGVVFRYGDKQAALAISVFDENCILSCAPLTTKDKSSGLGFNVPFLLFKYWQLNRTEYLFGAQDKDSKILYLVRRKGKAVNVSVSDDAHGNKQVFIGLQYFETHEMAINIKLPRKQKR